MEIPENRTFNASHNLPEFMALLAIIFFGKTNLLEYHFANWR